MSDAIFSFDVELNVLNLAPFSLEFQNLIMIGETFPMLNNIEEELEYSCYNGKITIGEFTPNTLFEF